MAKKKVSLDTAGKDILREYFAQIGAKGGKVGGKKRWSGKTDREISEAMKAVAARRKKKKNA